VLSAPITATAKINKNQRRFISKFTIFDYWPEFAAAAAAANRMTCRRLQFMRPSFAAAEAGCKSLPEAFPSMRYAPHYAKGGGTISRTQKAGSVVPVHGAERRVRAAARRDVGHGNLSAE
jgi:hypothetical protein